MLHKTRCLLFLVGVLCANGIHAQSEKDSFRYLINTMPEDTSKMEVYFNLGLLMETENLDSAAFYYEKAGKISEQYHHTRGQIKFISYKSYILNMQGKLDESYQLNKKALELARANNLELEAAKALANLANTHNFRGELDTAVQYYIEAAQLFDKLNNRQHLHILYMNIGVAFDALTQYEKAVSYQRKSVSQSAAVGDSLTLIRSLINMASSIGSLKTYDSAIRILEPVMDYSRRNGYTSEYYHALLNYANLLAKNKKRDKAFDAFKEALSLARQLEFPNGIATSLNGMAMVRHEQKKYAEADKYAMEALRMNEKFGVFTDLRQQYKLLADIKANLGQAKAAYKYLEAYVTLNDSLSSHDINRITAELEGKYQVAQKDKEIAEKELKIQTAEHHVRRKNAQLWIVVAALAFSVIILFILYRYFRQRQRLQRQQVRSLQREQEVIRLRSNLEGQQEERMRIAKEIHDDIGSGLTSLVFLTGALPDVPDMQEKKDKINGIARHMVTQMNEIVWSLNSEQDSLEDLIIFIRHNISEMLDTVGMEYEFRIPDDIPPTPVTGAQRRHVFLVVKEAVHNSIKHADATKVTIAISFGDHIQITVEDNGRGICGKKSTGNGMKNMQYRMKQLGGEWRLSSTQGVKIELTLPLSVAV